MLARGVHRAGPRVETVHAGGIHDVALTLIDEDRQKRSDAVNHTPEVDPQKPAPRRERTEPRVSAACHASVVTHDMHGSEALDSSTRQRLNRPIVTDVRGYGQRPDTQCTDPVGSARQSCFFYIRQNNVKPIAREPLGKRQPNPARRSRDDETSARRPLRERGAGRLGCLLLQESISPACLHLKRSAAGTSKWHASARASCGASRQPTVVSCSPSSKLATSRPPREAVVCP